MSLLVGASILGLSAGAGISTSPANATSAQLVIAIVGDYGICHYESSCSTSDEQHVATLVHGWNPDLIWTVGDNSYLSGLLGEVQGDGSGPSDSMPYLSDINVAGHTKYWQVAGNHDWDGGDYTPSLNFFGHPAHYVAHFGSGLIDFFAVDMNQDTSSTGTQATQYYAAVNASTAIWKIAADHEPPYSSGSVHGSSSYTHWMIRPQIDLFLAGHDHEMEHLVEGGQNFVVQGAGGNQLYTLGPRIAGSVWGDDQHFGATRLVVTPTSLTVQYIAVGGAVLHSFQLTKGAQPTPTPTPAPTPTPTPAPTPTPTPAPTPTPTAAPTPTPTPAPTPTHSPTPTPTPTHSATPTPTPTHSATPTPTPAHSATPAPTSSTTHSATPTPRVSTSSHPATTPKPTSSAAPKASTPQTSASASGTADQQSLPSIPNVPVEALVGLVVGLMVLWIIRRIF